MTNPMIEILDGDLRTIEKALEGRKNNEDLQDKIIMDLQDVVNRGMKSYAFVKFSGGSGELLEAVVNIQKAANRLIEGDIKDTENALLAARTYMKRAETKM